MDLLNMTEDERCTLNSSSEMNGLNSRYLRHSTANIIGCFVTVLIAIISIIGNVAAVMVSFWSETLRIQTGNIFVVYLSIIDILTGIFVMIPSAIAVAKDYWPLGNAGCKMHAILNYMFACSSSFNLAVISFDRAIAVLYPFKYPAIMTPNIIMTFCGYIFMQSFIIGLVCGVPNWCSYDYSEAVCALDYTTSAGVYYLTTTGCFFCYFTPALIVAVCNTMIILTANRSNKLSQPLFVRRDKANTILKESIQKENHMKKTINSMIVVVVTYFICFTPYALSKQAKVILEIDMPPWFNYLTTIMIFIASATNPFIYGILRKDYRDAFKRLPGMLIKKLGI